LFGWCGFVFRFDGIGRLRVHDANAKNNRHQEQSIRVERDMVGVDDLQFLIDFGAD
jgi:hypothetical protein